MHIVSVTVHNHADPSCRRLTITQEFKMSARDDPMDFVMSAIKQAEYEHRTLFTRNMSYTVPYTEVTITPREVLRMREAA